MDWSWLALLVCPLMMLPLMLMMMKGSHSEPHTSSDEFKRLKKQNSLLREELRQLKSKN
ncbi:hypothetical protein [Sporolactobacillus terrae]|uniref:DUF2933 domain-containing protein n=1 Tax=Sporolactobacillus terrae TaxID=269673 RepID=A0A5K7WYS9_9BACL|nr:hypothetical protein [Sporolactobacillus terrae]UAK16165.1 hypothetical protein K7399_14545 [Sporolactobacillus terrae]BBN97620.1 hypothetical protein St703_03250 [Sporolactobacillus terrae]